MWRGHQLKDIETSKTICLALGFVARVRKDEARAALVAPSQRGHYDRGGGASKWKQRAYYSMDMVASATSKEAYGAEV